ncbi:TPA: DUF2278 family protein [Bacillus pseudomycoides]|nr:DUF2278 family protein [Bacillus pseudomycoides]
MHQRELSPQSGSKVTYGESGQVSARDWRSFKGPPSSRYARYTMTVHDNIHMNQGNSKYSEENGTLHDACILIRFKKENKWIAYFLAFQSQSWRIDDEGNPLKNMAHRTK